METAADERGHVTRNTYDALNRLLTSTEAYGTAAARTTTNDYDAVGNLTRSWDYLSKLTEYAYDGLNRPLSTTGPLLHAVSDAYDKVGNLKTVTDATNKVTQFLYNALDQRTKATDPNTHDTTSLSDAAGNVVLTTDGVGNPAYRSYDERGQLVLEVDARGGTTRRSYDAAGNLSVLVDPAGNEWTWQYDGLNREVVRTDPLGKDTLTAYDSAGLVSSVTDRLGRQKVFTYDADNRVSTEVWKDALGATVDTRSFTYDDAGNLLTAGNAAGTYTRTYDEFGRLETQSGLYGVGYAFAYNGREMTGVTDTLGGAAAYSRDDAGRVTRRTFTDGTTSVRLDLGYNARDERTSETRYADLAGTVLVGSTIRGYDDAGNLTGLHYKDASAATISNYVNAFDAADRITSETRNGGTPVTFSYDTTSQLTADSAASYSYDLAGNRTMAGYSTGASNRIASDGTWGFSYDDEGNVTKRSKGALAETWTYGYDNDNQMAWAEQRATDGGTLLMRLDFTYDVFSQRVKEVKTAGGTTERRYSFADRGEAEAELDATNALVTRYLRGEAQGELWGRVGSSGAAWLLQDRLGSLRDVADATGAGVDHIDYDGFGNVVAESAPTLTGDYTWTGLWRQRETETFHAFWRDYGASWGGWMQQDPILFEAGDPNLYRYVGNNPTNATDPTGLSSSGIEGTPNAKTIQAELHKEFNAGDRRRVFWLVVFSDAPPRAPKDLIEATKGHAWIALIDASKAEDPPGSSLLCLGLHPSDASSLSRSSPTTPGIVKDDSDRRFTMARGFVLTKTQFDDLKKAMLADLTRPPTYHMMKNNCASWAVGKAGPFASGLRPRTFAAVGPVFNPWDLSAFLLTTKPRTLTRAWKKKDA